MSKWRLSKPRTRSRLVTKTFPALPRRIVGLMMKRHRKTRLLTADEEVGHLRR